MTEAGVGRDVEEQRSLPELLHQTFGPSESEKMWRVQMERVGAVLVTVIMFSTHTLNAQEHAPTIDVCRADVAVWANVQTKTDYNNAEANWVRNEVSNRTPIAKLSIKEVIRREDEMSQCMEVDPDKDAKDDSYFNAQSFYHSVLADRWIGFITRHHLMSQLRQEDAAGKR